MKFNIGDKVENIKNGDIGIVIRIFKTGSIAVLERVNPVVICTYDSCKMLKLIKECKIDIFDETLNWEC